MAMSVNTNPGALFVLKFMRQTSVELSTVQNRVSTGLNVSSALDDASTFAVAQGLRGDLKGYTAVNQALGAAVGMAKVALAAATAISNKMQDIQAKLVQLSDESISAATRTTYNSDYTAMTAQLQTFIDNANYNGVNLLQTASTNQNVIANIDGSIVTIRSNDLETNILAAAPADAVAAQTSLAAGGDFVVYQTDVNNALAQLGADIKLVEGQNEFIKQIGEAAQEGLGSLVDADLSKESAALQGLQVKQQLGIQALSIANQAPGTLLGLFR